MKEQIEELAKKLRAYCYDIELKDNDDCRRLADFIIDTLGYRKPSEVAREIFSEIDKILDFATENTPLRMPFNYIDMRFVPYYNELKKKYTEGNQ